MMSKERESCEAIRRAAERTGDGQIEPIHW